MQAVAFDVLRIPDALKIIQRHGVIQILVRSVGPFPLPFLHEAAVEESLVLDPADINDADSVPRVVVDPERRADLPRRAVLDVDDALAVPDALLNAVHEGLDTAPVPVYAENLLHLDLALLIAVDPAPLKIFDGYAAVGLRRRLRHLRHKGCLVVGRHRLAVI